MYEKLKTYLADPIIRYCVIGVVLVVGYCLWFRTGDRSVGRSAYQSAGYQLTDAERDRQTVETGLTESQQTINGVSDRIRDSQQTIYRAEDRQRSTENLFRECEQITRELKRRAESRETQK